MPTYRAIAATETDPEAPLAAQLMKALAANPIAMFEGAPGAPRLRGEAMFAPNAGTVVQRNCLPFGSEELSSSGSATLNVIGSAFTALVNCTVQVRLSCTIVEGVNPTDVRVLKNGAAVQTYTTSQAGATVNIALNAGDCLGVVVRVTYSGTGIQPSITLSELQIRVDQRSAVMT